MKSTPSDASKKAAPSVSGFRDSSPGLRKERNWQALSFENGWVRAEDNAKLQMPASLALVIVAIVVYVAVSQWVFVYDLALAQFNVDNLSAIEDRTLTFILIFLPILTSYFILSMVCRRPLPRGGIGFLRAFAIGALVGGSGCGLAVCIACFVGAASLVDVPPYSSSFVAGLTAGAALLAFQVSSEELLFRGWLLPILAAKWGPWVGLLISALLFSGLHQYGQPFQPVQFFNQALGGLLFGLLMLRSGTLIAPIMAHFAWNLAYFHILGLAPNPGADSLGSVFDFDLIGDPLLFGGNNEMISGLVATFTLSAMCLLLIIWKAKATSGRA